MTLGDSGVSLGEGITAGDPAGGGSSRSHLGGTGAARDHGGGLDSAMARWSGRREDWLDLSTGINPVPYPLPPIPGHAWTALPDRRAAEALLAAARTFWRVPAGAEVIAAPGLSALIARLPDALGVARIHIPGPTYNEYAASFSAAGVALTDDPAAPAVLVHPNNPDGRLWPVAALDARPVAVVDESFCDAMPEQSHVARTASPTTIVLKSFGKFWGLAGLRLGFAILAPGPIAEALRDALGPWPVSGPALAVGAAALSDPAWAEDTRARLREDARRLDVLMGARGAHVAGGTPLFRLYKVEDAQDWYERLAQKHVLSRVFPYSRTWLRLGLPSRWDQLEAAL